MGIGVSHRASAFFQQIQGRELVIFRFFCLLGVNFRLHIFHALLNLFLRGTWIFSRVLFPLFCLRPWNLTFLILWLYISFQSLFHCRQFLYILHQSVCPVYGKGFFRHKRQAFLVFPSIRLLLSFLFHLPGLLSLLLFFPSPVLFIFCIL